MDGMKTETVILFAAILGALADIQGELARIRGQSPLWDDIFALLFFLVAAGLWVRVIIREWRK